MYAFVDLAVKSLRGGGSIVPQTRGSHTPILVSGLAVTLKMDIIIIIIIIIINPRNQQTQQTSIINLKN